MSILKAIWEGPILEGPSGQGKTLFCCQCEALLGIAVPGDALWGIGLRCFHCGHVSFSTSPPASRPIPQKALHIDAGEYGIGSTLKVNEYIPFVGTEAIMLRRQDRAPAHLPPSSSEVEALEALAERGEQLLGKDFPRLYATFQRSRVRTQPKAVNRLVELIALAREDADASRLGNPRVHLLERSELSMAVSLFERWRADPCMAEMLASLKNPPDFPHVLITLGAASYLTDAGNPTELVPSDHPGRSPDLRVHIDLRRRVNVEVKTPKKLLWPQVPLLQEDLVPVVRKAMTKAGSGTGGQLGPEHPGTLVIGGLNLRTQDMIELERSAEVVLRERPDKRMHIGGVVLINSSHVVEGVNMTKKGLSLGPTIATTPVLQPRLVTNSFYRGETEFTSGGLQPAEDLEDIPLTALQDAQIGQKIGRNDPCWCGSKLKFKKCHGR